MCVARNSNSLWKLIYRALQRIPQKEEGCDWEEIKVGK